MPFMREIGRITLTQVQRSALVIEYGSESYYEPSPLMVVEYLLLFPQGVSGITAGGCQLMDIHHENHPNSHNHKGINGLSLGFTSHYQAMRSKLGEHLTDGIAGENIVVESNTPHALSDLGERLAIQNQQNGQFVYLAGLKVATPCVEFSLFASNHGKPLPAAKLKETLQFLNGGMRGFYARLEELSNAAKVQAGDRVFVVDGE